MKVVLNKLRNFADTLLLTPVDRAIEGVDSASFISVFMDNGPKGMLDACTYIDHILLKAASDEKKRIRSLSQDWLNLSETCAEKYDSIFSLTGNARGRGTTVLSSARTMLASGKHFWAELARLIHGAQLFTVLDTVAIHGASSCKCPVIPFFDSSIEHHWLSHYEAVNSSSLPHTRDPDLVFHSEKQPMAASETTEFIASCDKTLVKHPRLARSA
jgi:ADP-heptose:LPS heptosyltransferase